MSREPPALGTGDSISSLSPPAPAPAAPLLRVSPEDIVQNCDVGYCTMWEFQTKGILEMRDRQMSGLPCIKRPAATGCNLLSMAAIFFLATSVYFVLVSSCCWAYDAAGAVLNKSVHVDTVGKVGRHFHSHALVRTKPSPRKGTSYGLRCRVLHSRTGTRHLKLLGKMGIFFLPRNNEHYT